MWQGVRPAGLAKVPTQELAEFVTVCIAPREERPRARQLLKHPYFVSVRSEKAAVKLSAEALLGAGASSADLHLLLAECAGHRTHVIVLWSIILPRVVSRSKACSCVGAPTEWVEGSVYAWL